MLQVRLERGSGVPLYRQIESAIRRRIADGELLIGRSLPPERVLAERLGVDRTTVVSAYRELTASGLIEAHVGRGTRVADRRLDQSADGAASAGVDWNNVLAMRGEEDPILGAVSALASRSDVISFAGGVPAPESYPANAFRELIGEALDGGGPALLQYSPPEGLSSLRRILAERMAVRGMPVPPSGVIVCAGSQQGLYLIARALVEPDDVVVVEAPTYVGALQVFGAVRARIVSIPVDQDGMDVERLADLLRRRTVKLIYTLPTFQNPTGATMSVVRRERLLALARRYGVAVIEDDPYSEIRYDGERLPSLLELDHAAGTPVIYLSTFSKVLFPGFRLGWVAAPGPVVERLAWVKALVDLDTNPLVQWSVAEFVHRGMLDDHVRGLRELYPERRDRIMAAIEHHLGDAIAARAPSGGFYVWGKLANGTRASDVLTEADATAVAFVPGEVFHADGGGRGGIRLAFSAVSLDDIDEGIARLGEAVRAATARRAGQRRRGRSTRIV